MTTVMPRLKKLKKAFIAIFR